MRPGERESESPDLISSLRLLYLSPVRCGPLHCAFSFGKLYVLFPALQRCVLRGAQSVLATAADAPALDVHDGLWIADAMAQQVAVGSLLSGSSP